MYYSVFDYIHLDTLHNLSSIEECICGIREFASMADYYKPEMSNDVVCDIWGFCVFSHENLITEPTRTPRKVIEDKYNISIIYDYDKYITTTTERDSKLKATMSAKELFEVAKKDLHLDRMGKQKVITKKKTIIFNCNTQTMYGDILDWFRDYYPDERPVWDDAARLLIGDWVIHNSIL